MLVAWLQTCIREARYPLTILAVVASHVCLLPTLLWTWHRRRLFWLEFVFFASLLAWSTLYHFCYATQVCPMEPRDHRLLDHFFAQMALPVLVFYLACIDRVHVKGILFFVVAQVDLLLLYYCDMDETNNYILIGVSVGLAVVHGIYHAIWHEPLLPVFDWLDASVGFTLGLVAIVFYRWNDIDAPNYWFSHGIWHCFSFIGSYFVLEARNPDRVLGLRTRTWKIWWTQLLHGCKRRKSAAAPHIV